MGQLSIINSTIYGGRIGRPSWRSPHCSTIKPKSTGTKNCMIEVMNIADNSGVSDRASKSGHCHHHPSKRAIDKRITASTSAFTLRHEIQKVKRHFELATRDLYL